MVVGDRKRGNLKGNIVMFIIFTKSTCFEDYFPQNTCTLNVKWLNFLNILYFLDSACLHHSHLSFYLFQ